MTSERGLWVTLERNLGPYGALKRIECTGAIGTPDVCYCLGGVTGWIELKEEDHWPKRSGTPITVRSLKLEQVCWLEDWAKLPGGRAFLLLQIVRTYMLLPATIVRPLFERRLNRVELIGSAVATGEGRFPTRAMYDSLTTRHLPQGNATGYGAGGNACRSPSSPVKPVSAVPSSGSTKREPRSTDDWITG